MNKHFTQLKEEFTKKFKKGKMEYGTDLYKDYTLLELMQHTKEELMDAVCYLDAIIVQLKNK